MKQMLFDDARIRWSDFRHGLLSAFGLHRYDNRFQLLSERMAKPTWEVVGEALADAMNDYGAGILKNDPGARLPQRARPVAGSLPDPAILGHYEREWPGSADQILTMAETRLHQHNTKLAAGQNHFQRAITLGVIAGTAILLAVLIIGFLLASKGHWLPGMAGILLVAAVSAVQFRVASGR